MPPPGVELVGLNSLVASMVVSVTHTLADSCQSILDCGPVAWLEARVIRYLGDIEIWGRVLRQCDLACQKRGSALREEL
eukprot:4116244-Alexandrium_andersonii.AAC.1